MAIDANTVIGPLLDQHGEKVFPIFEKHGMGALKDPGTRSMAAGASLSMASSYMGMSAEKLQALIDDLNAAVPA